ncbi:unnamed protein product [Phytophthora fragariaefolia]|uniref:Unnamed protein product n=1 Tax=Phytophthora fragariaefolia TaxID=1490495 RepID=A0A9W7CVY0_9STRA|nr:unnamed protein product [Phytophthora fragariaefolia]
MDLRAASATPSSGDDASIDRGDRAVSGDFRPSDSTYLKDTLRRLKRVRLESADAEQCEVFVKDLYPLDVQDDVVLHDGGLNAVGGDSTSKQMWTRPTKSGHLQFTARMPPSTILFGDGENTVAFKF